MFFVSPALKPVTVQTRWGVLWAVTLQRLATGYKSLGVAFYVYICRVDGKMYLQQNDNILLN
jgi:hypothetical protein